ncbi:glycoside hydrolase family 47 protein [Aaosphaeria arxii CBS 175.79]|uniref:alpha-1,2-Mannosidase n=1 Tax=Aaosphaeria arxii CBS 175.79 TaxID=1450172 RepID=A0A6A5XAL9_9PLEO|nr:glycoside hydrolase family 47 protein [Aaosphaeria arxii CBS 175.79]KAF2010018.1 glycoside hydrolase family 47 protein [Aaosphaeria arxii CBS 175.79]
MYSKQHKPRRIPWLDITGISLITLVFIILCATLLPWKKTTSTTIGKPNICPNRPPSPAFVPNTQGRYNWRDYPAKYPVESYASLPTDEPAPIPRIQFKFGRSTPAEQKKRLERQEAVKATFKRCWQAYKDFAWTKDELMPMSGGSRETFGGWGATLIDSLDTLWIMGLQEEFAEAVEAAVMVDFSPKGGEINMFEVIIRYLGGFIGAYDVSGCFDQRLLNKAVEVADMAYATYDTHNRMPVTRWDPQKAVDGEEQLPPYSGSIAELASASLEFTRLSQLTGDMRYFDAAKRITDVLHAQQNLTRLPGMWPKDIDQRMPNLKVGVEYTLGSMADSAYEYLPKMYQLLSGRGDEANRYLDMYTYAMSTAINATLFRPMLHDNADILFAGTLDKGKRLNIGMHLSCFVGGMLLLGGRLSSNTTHESLGLKVTDGCVYTYHSTPSGIMPEEFSMTACPSLSACPVTGIPSSSSPFDQVLDPRYILRPEAIEAVFYAYRVTGDTAYQDVAWAMFEAIDTHTRTSIANGAVADVMSESPGTEDSMESFWLAETLKYFYLVFAGEEVLGLDEWVFNTEAHAFRIPGGGGET